MFCMRTRLRAGPDATPLRAVERADCLSSPIDATRCRVGAALSNAEVGCEIRAGIRFSSPALCAVDRASPDGKLTESKQLQGSRRLTMARQRRQFRGTFE